MPVIASVTIVRPEVAPTDTISAALYNATGVASVTAVIEGAVATDGTTPITGDLTVTGRISAASMAVDSLMANGVAGVPKLTCTGAVSIGAGGTVTSALRAGKVSFYAEAATDGQSFNKTVTIAGAGAATVRFFDVRSSPGAASALKCRFDRVVSVTGDSVTLAFVAIGTSAITDQISLNYLFL